MTKNKRPLTAGGGNFEPTRKTMFNHITAIITRPVFVCLNTFIGATCMAYLQDTAIIGLQWFIPCLCVIVCDLITGLRAAHYRKEVVSMSSAARRTISKILVYLCWVLMSITVSRMYDGLSLEKWIMGIVLIIEIGSCVSNILEPHGITLRWEAVLNKLGVKMHVDNLGDVIETKKCKKEKN